MEAYRSLFIRGNRALGLALVEAGLITQQAQDAASARLLELMQAGPAKSTGLLPILIHEQQSLDENALLQYMNTRHHLALVNLDACDVKPPIELDPQVCWATWTLPFDEREGIHFVASCYYMSHPVRAWWEQNLGKNIVWFATTLSSMIDSVERLSANSAAK